MSLTIASKQPASSQRRNCWYTTSQGWQIMRQQSPQCTSAHKPAQRVEHLPQIMPTLRHICIHQRQVRRHEMTFFFADVARVGFAAHGFSFSVPSNSGREVHNTL